MGQAFKDTRGRADGKVLEACLMAMLDLETEKQPSPESKPPLPQQ